jgi:carbonic anhydrase
MSLGTKECGTLKASLVAVKTELEAMGNAHAEVAAGMRRELEEALTSFANTVRERRKLVQTNVDRLRRTKAAQEQQLQKLKEKYEADCIKINGFIAQQNMLMGKELDKVTPQFSTPLKM